MARWRGSPSYRCDRPGVGPGLSWGVVVEPPAGIEPATPSLPWIGGAPPCHPPSSQVARNRKWHSYGLSRQARSWSPRTVVLLQVVADYKRLSAVQGAGRTGPGRASGPQYPRVTARHEATERPGVGAGGAESSTLRRKRWWEGLETEGRTPAWWCRGLAQAGRTAGRGRCGTHASRQRWLGLGAARWSRGCPRPRSAPCR
jgi:hypothetical protein